MNQLNKSHNFNFEGGEYLTQIGASWFVSYSYYCNVDKKHSAWKNIKTSSDRISIYNSTINHHKFWLKKILEMSVNKLNTNKIGLNGIQVKQMAIAILDKFKN